MLQGVSFSVYYINHLFFFFFYFFSNFYHVQLLKTMKFSLCKDDSSFCLICNAQLFHLGDLTKWNHSSVDWTGNTLTVHGFPALHALCHTVACLPFAFTCWPMCLHRQRAQTSPVNMRDRVCHCCSFSGKHMTYWAHGHGRHPVPSPADHSCHFVS